MATAKEKEGMPHIVKKNKERPESASKIEDIGFREDKVKIGASLEKETCKALISLLSRNKYLFAWELKDLAGLD